MKKTCLILTVIFFSFTISFAQNGRPVRMPENFAPCVQNQGMPISIQRIIKESEMIQRISDPKSEKALFLVKGIDSSYSFREAILVFDEFFDQWRIIPTPVQGTGFQMMVKGIYRPGEIDVIFTKEKVQISAKFSFKAATFLFNSKEDEKKVVGWFISQTMPTSLN